MAEKKYIDAERAIKEIAETNIIQYEVDIEGFAKSQKKITLQRDTKQAIIDLLDDIPAADVAEVRRGHWSDKQVSYQTQDDINFNTYHFGFKCSVCGGVFNKTSYCGGCGATMDG